MTVPVIILCLYSAKTISRNRAWKDNFTLSTTDVLTSRNSAKANFEAGLQLFIKVTNPDNDFEAKQRDEYCENAIRFFKRSIELFPYHNTSFEMLSELCFDCYQDIVQSVQFYTKGLQSNSIQNDSLSKKSIIFSRIIAVLSESEQVITTSEETIRALDELLKVQPDIGEVWFLKGVIFGKYMRNTEMALINLEQALILDFPKTALFYEYLGSSYGLSGNYLKAVQYLLKAVELGTDDFNTFLKLGVLYKELGNRDEADYYIKKAKQLNNK
jgi:tetratricopeptide (TPR) repeat protein